MNKQKASMIMISFLLILTGCSGMWSKEDSQIDKKKLTLIHNSAASTLDPHNSWAALRAGAVETLLRLNSDLTISPWLATEWKSIDARTWLFTLRDHVTFHDGTKMDAAAVKSSLERAMQASRSIAQSLNIDKMKADGLQLTIVTSEPNPALPSELVNPYTSVISTAAENKLGTSAFNNAPVGTGPFKVSAFAPNREINLVRYDGYWDTPAKLDEVSYQFSEDANVRLLALQSQEADIAYQLPAESIAVVEQDAALKVDSVTGLRVHFLSYNSNRPHMKDIQVRKALDLLVDRDSVAKEIMQGHAMPANGPFPSTLPFGNQDKVGTVDSVKALELLKQAGYVHGRDGKLEKDGKPLTIQLITYKTRPELPIIAQLFQSEAAKIGIGIEIKLVENADSYLRENDDWDIATYSNLSAPRGDGGFFLHAAYSKGGSLNPVNVEVAGLAQVLEQLHSTADIAARIDLSKQAVSLIKADVPHSYVIYPNVIIGRNKRVIDWAPRAEEYYIITNKMDIQ